MMEKSKLVILLLMVSFALTVRCASLPHKNLKQITVIVNGTKQLEDLLEKMNNLNLRSKDLDKQIDDLQKGITSLPIELSESHQELLEKLYRSQDRVVRVRTVLVGLANQIKLQSQNLIDLYEDNKDQMDQGLLNYSVKKFLKLARDVNEILKAAEITLDECQAELSGTKSIMSTYKVEIIKQTNAKQQTLTEENEKFQHDMNIVHWVVGFITVGLSLAVSLPIANNAEAAFRSNIYHIQTNVYNVRGTLEDLLSHNKELKSYINKELMLITVWKNALQQSITDHEDGINAEDIKYGIGTIKRNLETLIKVCDAYLANKLPEALQPQRSSFSITPSSILSTSNSNTLPEDLQPQRSNISLTPSSRLSTSKSNSHPTVVHTDTASTVANSEFPTVYTPSNLGEDSSSKSTASTVDISESLPVSTSPNAGDDYLLEGESMPVSMPSNLVGESLLAGDSIPVSIPSKLDGDTFNINSPIVLPWILSNSEIQEVIDLISTN